MSCITSVDGIILWSEYCTDCRFSNLTTFTIGVLFLKTSVQRSSLGESNFNKESSAIWLLLSGKDQNWLSLHMSFE